MDSLQLSPIRHVGGVIRLPGSKSLSNRLLLLAALARGSTRVENLLDADDVHVMLEALARLGVPLRLPDDRRHCDVDGLGGPFPPGSAELWLGNAGTAMRPLCAALCLGSGEFTLGGEPRMHERPIGHLVDALVNLGADIQYRAQPGFPPVTIRARGLRGGRTTIDGSVSSQFLSALLLAAPLTAEGVEVEMQGALVSAPYVDMTVRMMQRFGAVVDRTPSGGFQVPGQQSYRSPGSILVEGDASSASYFLAAAAIRGGTVRVEGVGADSVQGDVRFVDVLGAMGAIVTRGDQWLEVSRGQLRGITVDATDFPDAAMTVAATALFAEGPTHISGIGNWRVKETDRLTAMATELRKVGASVEEGPDYLRIEPPSAITAATVETYGDHRIAMCFSLAALGDAPITISNPAVTSKTFPGYFAQLESLVRPE